MKVVLLGATGMLGRQLGDIFSDTDLVTLDQEAVDITNLVQLRDVLQREEPELVLNAAAYTDVDGAENNKELAFAVNEGGVRNVAVASEEIDATVVHYSTDYVFPGDIDGGYAEDAEPGPAINLYGASKLAGEEALQEEVESFYLVRTAWLYGPGGENFVDTMLKLATEKDSLSIVNDQQGSPTFTRDVAKATRKLVDEDYELGVYHLVNEGVTTWYDLAVEVFKQAEISISVKPVSSNTFERPASRPAHSYLLNTEGPKMRNWQEALFEYLAQVV